MLPNSFASVLPQTAATSDTASTSLRSSCCAWRGIVIDKTSARTLDSVAELVQLARDDPHAASGVRFGVWQGPERPVDRDVRLRRQREIFLFSPLAASANGLTVRHASESGITADDLFQRDQWLHALTPNLAQSLDISWKTLAKLGLQKRHVLSACLPVDFWRVVLQADAEFEKFYKIRDPSTC